MAGKTKTTPPVTPAKPKDFSGYTVKSGEVLDLGGKTIAVTKPIKVIGTIRNGTIDGTKLGQFDSALQFPAGTAKGRAFDLRFQGHSYSGLAKVWANDVLIEGCTVLPGSAWSIQILGADRCIVRSHKQDNTRRGGIYFGDGTAYGTKLECVDCVIDGGQFVTSDEEALIRANTATNLRIIRALIDNTRCRVGKEAFQGRGLSGSLEDCQIYGSTSNGQQPNGRNQTAAFLFLRCLIYGYNSAEAGASLVFDGCTLVNRPTYGSYKLTTAGNGAVANAQSAARGLPDGKIVLKGCKIDAKQVTATGKRVQVIQ